MPFCSWAPASPLGDFIEDFCLYHGDRPAHLKERIVPSGTAELVIRDFVEFSGFSPGDYFSNTIVGPDVRMGMSAIADHRQCRLDHRALTSVPWRGQAMTTVNVRYMVDDVETAIAFYTTHLDFTVISKALPAFADVARGDLRLLLSGPTSSAGRPMPDGRRPAPGGWNRIHLIVEDLVAEVDRLRAAGVHFRNDIVTGPGGSQILLDDPSGNPIELFQPRRQ
jgi:catechol 2,3-dioxygenase-like lactoylglutathione lyase family enzyme